MRPKLIVGRIEAGLSVRPEDLVALRHYTEKVDEMDTPPQSAEPCENGHYGCALVEGGLCSDRALAALEEVE